MKSVARRVHVIGAFRRVQRREQAAQLGGVLGVDALRRGRHEEPFQPL